MNKNEIKAMVEQYNITDFRDGRIRVGNAKNITAEIKEKILAPSPKFLRILRRSERKPVKHTKRRWQYSIPFRVFRNYEKSAKNGSSIIENLMPLSKGEMDVSRQYRK